MYSEMIWQMVGRQKMKTDLYPADRPCGQDELEHTLLKLIPWQCTPGQELRQKNGVQGELTLTRAPGAY